MYAAKVKLGIGPDSHANREASDQSEMSTSGSNDRIETLAFSAGNPRVEHITGIVHLYREVPANSQSLGPPPALPVKPLFLQHQVSCYSTISWNYCTTGSHNKLTHAFACLDFGLPKQEPDTQSLILAILGKIWLHAANFALIMRKESMHRMAMAPGYVS